MLPFLNRRREIERLLRHLDGKGSSFLCLYGRRRCGKSRLIRHVLEGRPHTYYAADERDAHLQRRALAKEIARTLPGFDRVEYPGWDELFERYWADAPAGMVLAIDELPWLVAASPEVPSLLQKRLDAGGAKKLTTIVSGSSQRMMLGLVLDATAPLFGRAQEILRVEPLLPGEMRRAFHGLGPAEAVERYAVWGGVPHYWDLASGFEDAWAAVTDLILDPLGVLHEEPKRLLEDDLRETAQASSILSLIGSGCHRLSEIAARLGQASTSLSRPLQRLCEMGLVHREIPFGVSPRESKRSLYRLSDPFLSFWYRFVPPHRSRLSAGQLRAVLGTVRGAYGHHVGGWWEELVRRAIPQHPFLDKSWHPASRWWGKGSDGSPVEIDVVAECASDPGILLVGEAKTHVACRDITRILYDLEAKAANVTAFKGKAIIPTVWPLRTTGSGTVSGNVFSAADVVRV